MKKPDHLTREEGKRPGRIDLQRPFILVNMAMSADGKIATANQVISSFGSRRDQEHLLELRATADAVMSGARTVDQNPITMGPGPERFRRMRLRLGLAEYNLRVIVSRTGSVDPQARVFQERGSPILVLTTERAGTRRIAALRKVANEVIAFGKSEVDFTAAMKWLRQQWDVRRLLCEGGGELNDALFRAALVDELHLTICPRIFAGRGASTIADGAGFARLPQAAHLTLNKSRRIGDELFLVYAAPSQPPQTK